MIRPVLQFFKEIIPLALIAILIIYPIRTFVAQPFFVRGQSMEPTFVDGDYLIVDELSYRFREPQRGEVVVFRFPLDEDQYYIKRIVGLPGETIEVESGRLYSIPQGSETREPLAEWWYRELSGRLLPGEDFQVKIPEESYFVLGDNLTASYDSRRWGALPRKDIVGRVWLRVFPLERAQAFSLPAYQP